MLVVAGRELWGTFDPNSLGTVHGFIPVSHMKIVFTSTCRQNLWCYHLKRTYYTSEESDQSLNWSLLEFCSITADQNEPRGKQPDPRQGKPGSLHRNPSASCLGGSQASVTWPPKQHPWSPASHKCFITLCSNLELVTVVRAWKNSRAGTFLYSMPTKRDE